MLHCAGRAALEKLKQITADEAASISHGSRTQTEGENKVTGPDELFKWPRDITQRLEYDDIFIPNFCLIEETLCEEYEELVGHRIHISTFSVQS